MLEDLDDAGLIRRISAGVRLAEILYKDDPESDTAEGTAFEACMRSRSILGTREALSEAMRRQTGMKSSRFVDPETDCWVVFQFMRSRGYEFDGKLRSWCLSESAYFAVIGRERTGFSALDWIRCLPTEERRLGWLASSLADRYGRFVKVLRPDAEVLMSAKDIDLLISDARLLDDLVVNLAADVIDDAMAHLDGRDLSIFTRVDQRMIRLGYRFDAGWRCWTPIPLGSDTDQLMEESAYWDWERVLLTKKDLDKLTDVSRLMKEIDYERGVTSRVEIHEYLAAGRSDESSADDGEDRVAKAVRSELDRFEAKRVELRSAVVREALALEPGVWASIPALASSLNDGTVRFTNNDCQDVMLELEKKSKEVGLLMARPLDSGETTFPELLSRRPFQMRSIVNGEGGIDFGEATRLEFLYAGRSWSPVWTQICLVGEKPFVWGQLSSEHHFSDPDCGYRTFPDGLRATFADLLLRLDVGEWATSYEREDVKDGYNWTLRVDLPGERSIYCRGVNDGPAGLDELLSFFVELLGD